MKKLFSLLCLLCLSSVEAQNIAYEVVRTQEAPGYFALRVYPGNDLPPLGVETVMVENYHTRAERRRYEPLAEQLKNSGLTVLSSGKAVALVNNSQYRLVLLGGPKQQRWLQFKASKGDNITESFTDFSQKKLGPVYLTNLKADFGGNVAQVRPEELPFLDDVSTYFVGQFEKEIKTVVSLSGETSDLIIQADGVVDLSTYKPHQAEGVLKSLWLDLAPTPQKDVTNGVLGVLKNITTNAFPVFLALFGLGLMYLAVRPSALRTGMIEEIDNEFWHTPIEETPLYQAWEKSISWELSDRELRNYYRLLTVSNNL